MKQNRELLVFAGPNGSGKSTVIAAYLAQSTDVHYYCADEIAKEPRFQAIADENERNLQAMKTCEKRVYDALNAGLCVAYETVLSSDYKWAILDAARALNYRIIAIYVTTQDPAINVRRVQARVAVGGHAVPKEKIVARYERSMQRLGKLLRYADDAVVYDNSKEDERTHSLGEISIVLEKHNGKIKQKAKSRWLMKYIEN